MPSLAYANYAMDPFQVSFLFQSCISPEFLLFYVVACYGVCFLHSGSHVAAIFTSGGLTTGVCDATTLWNITLAGICAFSWWSVLCSRSTLSGCSFHYHATHSGVFQPFHLYGGAYGSRAQQRVTQSFCLPHMVERSLFFSRLCYIQ